MPSIAGHAPLGPLADPNRLHEPLELDGTPTATLLEWHRQMARIRRVEEVIGDLVASGEVRCPCHLAIGQEACAVGVAAALDPTDRAFGNHRSHGHFLCLGGTPELLLAEVLGRDTGCSRGAGGSMHLTAGEHGLVGSVPIVGATIPMAVGAALAAKLRGTREVAVAFFGDGATEEGGFHESLNLASSARLPVLFVCEHNLFSSHLHIDLRQPSDSIARFAVAHHVRAWTLDGNDVVAVARAAREAAAWVRAESRPALLELVTYRWRGHVGPREDDDVGVRRAEDLHLWRRRDPIGRLEAALCRRSESLEADVVRVRAEVDQEVATALGRARSAAFPPLDLPERVLYCATAETRA